MSFLTEDELYTLTRRTQGAAQMRVLKRQGIAFKLDGDGHPVTTWESVNSHSGRIRKRSQPNAAALQVLMSRRGQTKT